MRLVASLSAFSSFFFFFFNDPATTEIYTLSLHDALPICVAAALQDIRLVDVLRDPPSVRVLIRDRKSTRLNSSHVEISYAVFCLKKKKQTFHNRSGDVCFLFVHRLRDLYYPTLFAYLTPV